MYKSFKTKNIQDEIFNIDFCKINVFLLKLLLIICLPTFTLIIFYFKDQIKTMTRNCILNRKL